MNARHTRDANSQSDLHIFPTRLQTVNGQKFQLKCVLMSCEANKWCKKLTWTRPPSATSKRLGLSRSSFCLTVRLFWGTSSCARHPRAIMPAGRWQHNSPAPNESQEMTTCTSHLPPLVPRLPTTIFTHRECAIRTKCLPHRASEGGTSAAIRENWKELHSAKECWHQFPPLCLWGLLVKIKQALRSLLCWSWPEVCSGPLCWWTRIPA